MTSCCSTAETNCLSGNEPNIFRKAVFLTGVLQCSETPIPHSAESQETLSVQCPCTCYLIGLIQIAPALAAAETTDGQENLRFFWHHPFVYETPPQHWNLIGILLLPFCVFSHGTFFFLESKWLMQRERKKRNNIFLWEWSKRKWGWWVLVMWNWHKYICVLEGNWQ